MCSVESSSLGAHCVWIEGYELVGTCLMPLCTSWWNPTHTVSSPWSQRHMGLPSVLGRGGLLFLSQILEASVHETELTAYCWQRVRLDKSPYHSAASESQSRGSDVVSGQHGCHQIWTPPLRYNVLSGRTKKRYSSEILFIWLLTWEIAQQLKGYTTFIMQCQVDRKF